MVQNSKGMGTNLSLSTLPSPPAWVTSCQFEPKPFDFSCTGPRLRDTAGSRKLKGKSHLLTVLYLLLASMHMYP